VRDVPEVFFQYIVDPLTIKVLPPLFPELIIMYVSPMLALLGSRVKSILEKARTKYPLLAIKTPPIESVFHIMGGE
jgi:hypothetical protein